LIAAVAAPLVSKSLTHLASEFERGAAPGLAVCVGQCAIVRLKAAFVRGQTMRKSLIPAALLVLAGIMSAPAQTYPQRPITLVVPYPPGGTSDLIARLLTEPMKASLGQPIIIESVGGAGGTIGVGRVARAAPDGYTLGIGNVSTYVLNGAAYSLTYDLVKDFEPVALLTSNPLMIVTKSAVPATDLKSLIGWIKANQDKISCATVGAGSSAHIAGVYFENTTGVRFNYVPYRGGAPAVQDLMAGQVDLMFIQATDAVPHVRAGKIKGFAVTAKTRMPTVPDVPTVDEAGLPGFHMTIWNGLWAPRGTPGEIVAKLNAAAIAAMADATVRQRLADLGQELPPPDQAAPEALGAQQKAEIAKWWPIIRAAHIRAD
jgi:tripartite-type tricarboxylate transporter receptor subunit TctC